MEIEIQLTPEPIAEKISPPPSWGGQGAWLEFRGVVRGEENGQEHFRARIRGLSGNGHTRNPAYCLRIFRHDIPCLAAKVIHRVGIIPVGETAIYVGVASPASRRSHRLAGRIHGPAETGRADLETPGIAR